MGQGVREAVLPLRGAIWRWRKSRRCVSKLTDSLPLAAELTTGLRPASAQVSTAPGHSLEVARSRTAVIEPPEWFGVIKPSRLLATPAGPGTQAGANDLRLEFNPAELPDSDEDDDSETEGDSKILKLFENPLFSSQALSDYFRKAFGSSKSPGEGSAGSEMQVRSVRRVQQVGPDARPAPTHIRFTDDRQPGAALRGQRHAASGMGRPQRPLPPELVSRNRFSRQA